MAENFCILAGIDLGIKEGDCTMQYIEVGGRQRMFDGTLKVSVRAVKREATVAVALLTRAADIALRAACGNGATTVTWSGDIIGTPSAQANVEFTDIGFVGSGTTHFREPQLVIREI